MMIKLVFHHYANAISKHWAQALLVKREFAYLEFTSTPMMGCPM
jgi:hypothetical protein